MKKHRWPWPENRKQIIANIKTLSVCLVSSQKSVTLYFWKCNHTSGIFSMDSVFMQILLTAL